MSRVLACLVALVLGAPALEAQGIAGGVVSGVAGAPPQQPARDTRPAVPARSIIHGRVVAAESGLPLRKATIRATAPGVQGQHTTLTDSDGRYELRDLPAGRYSLNVIKQPYVSLSYGQTDPSGVGKPVVLADNQAVDNIDFRLTRGGVITGRVMDEFGEPVTNANVTSLVQQFSQGQRRLISTGGRSSTNDIGEYRIFGLSPGQYYISASSSPLSFMAPGNTTVTTPDDRSGYAPTYYPGVASVGGAQRIAIKAGQTLSEVNITLLVTRMASVSGFAVDAEGRPLSNGAVTLMPRGGALGMAGGGGQLGKDGAFTIRNVVPGDYTVRANAPRLPPVPGSPVTPPEFSIARITVNGDDVAGVRLAPLTSISLAGRVVFADQSASQSLNPSTIRVGMQAADPEEAGFGVPLPPPQALKDDFTFELKATTGRYLLRANVPSGAGSTNPWVLKAVRLNGVDVTDRGVDVDTRDINGIEIELTNRGQRVTGRATDASGEAQPDYAVLVFPQDRTRWLAAGNRYFATGRPGDDRQFAIATLPPGDYYAIAVDRYGQMDWQDPDYLDGLSRQATPLSLSEGDTRTLDLRLFTVN